MATPIREGSARIINGQRFQRLYFVQGNGNGREREITSHRVDGKVVSGKAHDSLRRLAIYAEIKRYDEARVLFAFLACFAAFRASGVAS